MSKLAAIIIDGHRVKLEDIIKNGVIKSFGDIEYNIDIHDLNFAAKAEGLAIYSNSGKITYIRLFEEDYDKQKLLLEDDSGNIVSALDRIAELYKKYEADIRYTEDGLYIEDDYKNVLTVINTDGKQRFIEFTDFDRAYERRIQAIIINNIRVPFDEIKHNRRKLFEYFHNKDYYSYERKSRRKPIFPYEDQVNTLDFGIIEFRYNNWFLDEIVIKETDKRKDVNAQFEYNNGDIINVLDKLAIDYMLYGNEQSSTALGNFLDTTINVVEYNEFSNIISYLCNENNERAIRMSLKVELRGA